MFITSTWSCSMTCWFLSSCPTSNHNLYGFWKNHELVVYRNIPTSNHNVNSKCIVPFLVVYCTIPTSNHNWDYEHWKLIKVVYRTIPTSNHNSVTNFLLRLTLYIVLFLHQTTTLCCPTKLWLELYIVLFLHQTTTRLRTASTAWCCISYYSYIKPQQYPCLELSCFVVYRTIPTSNHNCAAMRWLSLRLYIVLFLHQTTTWPGEPRDWWVLYIVLFLHQTTTVGYAVRLASKLYIVLFLHQTTTGNYPLQSYDSCISYYSYIKPQPINVVQHEASVVYRTIPTSNHNLL